jgi:hypothetical protein
MDFKALTFDCFGTLIDWVAHRHVASTAANRLLC